MKAQNIVDIKEEIQRRQHEPAIQFLLQRMTEMIKELENRESIIKSQSMLLESMSQRLGMQYEHQTKHN